VFEITFECNSLWMTFEASSYVRLVLYNDYMCVCEKLQCMCLHMQGYVLINLEVSQWFMSIRCSAVWNH